MLPIFKKLYIFLWLLVLPFLNQCTQADPKVNNSEKESLQKDTSKITQDTEPAIPKDIKRLPNWPLKEQKAAGKRYPFDEGQKDLDFASFREKLYQAVLKKDLNFLSSNIHDDIKFSFGVEDGKADFIKNWQLDSNPQDSELWSELESVLSLGGAFFDKTENSFYAPYIFMLEDIDDPYPQAVIMGEKVRLREEPSSKSKIVSSLNWNLVEVVNQEEYIEETINGETHYWIKVITTGSETGFVYGKYVRSPIDFRAGFEKYNGKWIMVSFIAGD